MTDGSQFSAPARLDSPQTQEGPPPNQDSDRHFPLIAVPGRHLTLSHASDQHTWPVLIHALGRFEVQVEAVTLQMEGKAWVKPLALLRALVLRGGRRVNVDELMRTLWDRHDGNARGAFDVTLSRLRKLLKRPDALLIRGGELELNPRLCWLDLWHFERFSFPLHAEADDSAIGALKSYQGIFLPTEAETPCSMAIRERLRAHFHAAILHVGTHLERSREWLRAVEIYHHATQADPLVEEYYYREMRCQAELGRLSEVRDTYDRCRQRISQEFNTRPSARLDRLIEYIDVVRFNAGGYTQFRQESWQDERIRNGWFDDLRGSVTGGASAVVSLAGNRPPPSPIRIRTLGQFDLAIHGTAQGMQPAGQRRPLDILRAMIALGGSAIPASALIDAVWNSDAVAPRGAFDTALMRLRTVLARHDAVQLHAGTLTLNPEVCWVDAWEFERAATHFLRTRLPGDAQRALALYGGEFLGNMDRLPCAAAMRERLSLKFRQVVTALGDLCERAHEWEGAARTYQAGIAADGGVEDFYRRLIHCYWRMGQQTDAIRAYRRCCDALQVLSRSHPSAVTTALYHRVLDSPMAAVSPIVSSW